MSDNWERYVPEKKPSGDKSGDAAPRGRARGSKTPLKAEADPPRRKRAKSRLRPHKKTFKEPIPWAYTTNAQWAKDKVEAGRVMARNIKEAKQEIVRVQMEKTGMVTKTVWAWPIEKPTGGVDTEEQAS